jgi:N-acetylneuraminic acid mutarotase
MIDCRPISRIAMKTPDPFFLKTWRHLLVITAAAFFGLESVHGAPFTARAYHSMAWTGNEMIIWGGNYGPLVNILNDGARYNPLTDSWMATASAPLTPRQRHTGVWTGNEMIIWGGEDSGGNLLNDGARYSPLADSWTAVTMNGAPGVRMDHTAVWTGNEMIVWGGSGFSYNDGGRYNPLTDSWTATTTTGAPTGRSYHTAVWTGTEMIIWGGYNGRPLKDGKRYNPLTDSWTPVITNGTPSGRYYHTAVWTGTEMIIWGGYGTGGNHGYLSDGGRYSPLSDSWTTVSTIGAPGIRVDATAVWTGTRMIVWGGFNGSVYVNTGAIYNPATDTWTPVNTTGAPSPRYLHKAVWTGTEMIVWGGYSGNDFVNDGGRYNPATDTWTPLPAATACQPGFPDDFECRTLLVGTNISFSCTNIGATAESGEPSHFDGTGPVPDHDAGASLWYSWTAPYSGGAVITANSSFPTPCLAVYTGNSFASFTRVASNHTGYAECRLVFNAMAGTNYQIAVDGTTAGNSGQGSFNLNLTLTPPPANDLFANRASISGPFFETSGSVIGATRETGEPGHTNNGDFPVWPQTLWWTWTAPDNLGVGAIPVKLIAEGVTFSPSIGVYTGTSTANLTNVPLTAQVVFTSSASLANFTAAPGATYQIALGGTEDFPTAAWPRMADYYLRLNIRALVLSFANTNSTINADYSVSFAADLQVTNYGSASSSALRVQVTAISGVSFDQDTGFTPLDQILLVTTNLPALDPGQGVVSHIAGVVPPPTFIGTNYVGYTAYAELQEQVGTNWFTLDQTFLVVGVQSIAIGTGGGVIQVDPGLTGAGFNPLTSVSVLGPLTVTEGSTVAYLGRARYASGYQYDFTNTVWTTTMFSITNGLFTAGSVTSNTPATLDAKYSSGGFTYDTPTNILILNLPPPTLANLLRLPDRNFQLSLQGVPGRQHVIEATTNLSPPAIWSSLMTNVTSQSGSLLFSDLKATNFSSRFYRAREN